jgi:hypothetical protein
MAYRILSPIDSDEVPDWERRPPKWSDLVDAVMGLEPGQSIPVEFDDESAAERARNAVRDAANLQARAVVVRTRLQKHDKDGGATLFLTKVHPAHQEAK